MDRALKKINDKVNSPPMELTLSALKKGNRFHATTSFDSNSSEFYKCFF